MDFAFFAAKKKHTLIQTRGLWFTPSSLQMKNIQKPTRVASTGTRHFRRKERTSRNLNYMLLLIVVAVIAIIVVVAPMTGCVIKQLHSELVVAFPLEVHQATDLEVVGAGELLPVSVEVHVTFLVEQHLDRPPAKATPRFLQVHASRLLADEILHELLWVPF
jgi:hypothetical protein